MAERATARSWWEDVDRRTTPDGEPSRLRRRASDHAPAPQRRRSGATRASAADPARRSATAAAAEPARRSATATSAEAAPGTATTAPAEARPHLSLVVSEPVDLSTPVARLSEASRAASRDATTGRRTVTITGQRPAPPRRRPDTVTRVGPRPDRIAMWAFLMGIFLVAVATATADAAPL